MTEIISEFSCRLVLDCELLPGIQRILVYACYCYGKVIMSATAADSFIQCQLLRWTKVSRFGLHR